MIFETSDSLFELLTPKTFSIVISPTKRSLLILYMWDIDLLEIVGHCGKLGLQLDHNTGAVPSLVVALVLSLSPDNKYVAILKTIRDCLLFIDKRYRKGSNLTWR